MGPKRRVMGFLAAAAALALAAAGCSSDQTGGRLGIVAGFYPLQFVAERVGGERVRVTNLTQPGAEPHDLELSPRQVGELGDAALVLYVHGFQPAVDEAVDSATALDVSDLVPLLPDGDPHIWLDPTRLATVAEAFAVRLGALDPPGAREYQERAVALGTDLATLDREYTEGLRSCARREVVVSHAAFGYLAQRYGLRQIAITGLSPETEPTPGQLAAAAEEARRVGATTIFFETLVSPAVAQAVADAVGADAAVLDPIEGLEPDSTEDYVSVMRANLVTLRSALGCA